MKTALAIVLAVIVIAAFGWVLGFKAMAKWCNEYVDSSTVSSAMVVKEIVSAPVMTIRQLKAIASERGIKGYGRMSKAALMESLNYA